MGLVIAQRYFLHTFAGWPYGSSWLWGPSMCWGGMHELCDALQAEYVLQVQNHAYFSLHSLHSQQDLQRVSPFVEDVVGYLQSGASQTLSEYGTHFVYHLSSRANNVII